jgi:hypothetical protein
VVEKERRSVQIVKEGTKHLIAHAWIVSIHARLTPRILPWESFLPANYQYSVVVNTIDGKSHNIVTGFSKEINKEEQEKMEKLKTHILQLWKKSKLTIVKVDINELKI